MIGAFLSSASGLMSVLILKMCLGSQDCDEHQLISMMTRKLLPPKYNWSRQNVIRFTKAEILTSNEKSIIKDLKSLKLKMTVSVS